MRNTVKILLIGLYVLLGGLEIWRRISMFAMPEIQPVGLVAFGGLFALSVIGLVGVGFFQNGWIRWPLAALFAAGSVVVDSYQWIVGDFMAYDAFITMLDSIGDLGDAASQQGVPMILALAKAAVILFGIGLKPQETREFFSRAAKIASVPIILLITAMLFFRGGEGAGGLPSAHSGTSYAVLYGYEYLTDNRGPRQAVSLKAARKHPSSDIVLIIDESIAGAYLDINDKNGIYSGLAKAEGQPPIHNFGLATSITHCSVGTNATLRYGGTRENYRDTVRSKPSLWAYAKAAGLQTIYIDAQRTGGAYQNLMDDAERSLINRWDQFGDVPVLQRDHAVADKLAGYLSDGKPQFILVNKVGAHFPVNDKFPQSHARYKPMLKRGLYADVTDMASKNQLDGRQSNWLLYRNSYRNTLLWNVGGFFDRLFKGKSVGGATIIYTSDHGQTFHERGDEGKATHCTPNPEIEEGLVPLVIIGGGQSALDWSGAAAAGKDRLSHYRIFPTVLGLMGYEKTAVEPDYGPDLLSAKPDPFTFNIKYNARLGSSPVWKKVALDEIVRPPVSDSKKPRLVTAK